VSINLLAGYRQLLDDYFVFRHRGELNPDRGLCFTRLIDADEPTEAELISHCVAHLRKLMMPPVLLDWSQTMASAQTQGTEFRQFFGQLWELQSQGGNEEEQQVYVERLNSLMQRIREPDPSQASALIVHGIGPIQEMSTEELSELGRLLSARMERSLPVFIFFRESYSDLLLALQRASDAIWALDETSYPAEFFLLHPHGFRVILEQNRRRPLRNTLPAREN